MMPLMSAMLPSTSAMLPLMSVVLPPFPPPRKCHAALDERHVSPTSAMLPFIETMGTILKSDRIALVSSTKGCDKIKTVTH